MKEKTRYKITYSKAVTAGRNTTICWGCLEEKKKEEILKNIHIRAEGSNNNDGKGEESSCIGMRFCLYRDKKKKQWNCSWAALSQWRMVNL